MAVTGPWNLPGWDDALRAAGCEIVCGPSIDDRPESPLDERALVELCASADAILASTRERITGAVLDAAPHARIVAKATIGVERIDLTAATQRGILVVNSPAPENIIGLAEATVGLIVALAKRLLEKEARLRSGGWRDADTDGLVIAGRTVGIVGLGRVGGEVARRLAGWDVTLLASDPYVAAERFGELGARHVPLMELLSASDVVTLHVPLTDETREFIGHRELEAMRDGAFLINTSRGPVLDEEAMVDVLTSGHLGGAALDVFSEEPMPADSTLRGIPRERLILTPHSIGSSRGSRGTGNAMAVAAILDALDGKVPDHVVNPEVVPAWRTRFSTVDETTGARE